MAARYKRKTHNFFLKKDLQGKFVLAVFLSLLIGCMLFALLLAFFSADTMTISYTDNAIKVGATPWMLFKSAVAANWLFVLIGGTVLILAAIVGTHRIAGPLFHFEKTLDTMKSGDLSYTINLREKDEGKKLAEKINSFNAALSKNLSSIDRHSRAIKELLTRFDSIDKTSINPEDVASICKAIQQHNEKLRKQISFFTLSND